MDPEQSRRKRDEMVRFQIEQRGIHASRVLEAMREIPRELFVPADLESQAYHDGALSIGLRQTISQPYIVALMTEALELRGGEKVLEIGTGSGYQAAILARLARWVYTIERLERLSNDAVRRLEKLGVSNVTFLLGDGTLGFAPESPYDGIIVTAAAPDVPPSLQRQLNEGGRLVIPIGDRYQQVLYQFIRQGEQLVRRRLCDCVFVPLIGQEGWPGE